VAQGLKEQQYDAQLRNLLFFRILLAPVGFFSHMQRFENTETTSVTENTTQAACQPHGNACRYCCTP
uniref:Uncharacterized protein n=1 Tax=Phasianus colchicus TaxID=9054 RepID=A0A669QFL8_PHACC